MVVGDPSLNTPLRLQDLLSASHSCSAGAHSWQRSLGSKLARWLGEHSSSPRSPDWLARKILREHIDLVASQVIVSSYTNAPNDDGAQPNRGDASLDPVVAVLLIARPSVSTRYDCVIAPYISLLVVAPEFRKRGLGSRLLATALAAHHRLGVLAEPPMAPWYRRFGFRVAGEFATLLHFGRQCRDDPATLPSGAGLQLGAQSHWRELCHPLPGIIAPIPGAVGSFALQTPHPETRQAIEILGTMEGRARAIHRCRWPSPQREDTAWWAGLSMAIRDRFSSNTAILLVGCRQGSPATRSLLDAGWSDIQRFAAMYCGPAGS